MTSTVDTGARGAWPRASGPVTDGPAARAWLADQAAALPIAPGTAIPQFGTAEWWAADENTRRVSALRALEARHEDDDELRERLRREVGNERAAHLTRVHEAMDQANEAIREDRQALAKLPTLAELQARRREYPEPREPIQTPNWPPVLIPGSGGRRLGEPNEGAA